MIEREWFNSFETLIRIHRFFQILLTFFYCYFVDSAQLYIPDQVVFTLNGSQILYAIDEIDQRAFTTSDDSSSYVFQHFPYAPSDTPQWKYYTYWKYAGNASNYFPSHCAEKRKEFCLSTAGPKGFWRLTAEPHKPCFQWYTIKKVLSCGCEYL